MEVKRKPWKTIRLSTIACAIWRNEGEHGFWYSCTFTRSYKNKEGEWEYSDSMNRDDLLVMSRCAEKGYDIILKQMNQDRIDAQGTNDDDVDFDPDKMAKPATQKPVDTEDKNKSRSAR